MPVSCGRGFQYAKNDAGSAAKLGKYPFPGPSVDFSFRDYGPAKTGDPLQRPPYDEGNIDISDFRQGIGILLSCGCDKADYRAHRKEQCSRS
jgi:hypothetical protein